MSGGTIRLRTEGFTGKLALATFNKFCQKIPNLTKRKTDNSRAHLCTVTTTLASNITAVTVVRNFTITFLVTKFCLVTNVTSVKIFNYITTFTLTFKVFSIPMVTYATTMAMATMFMNIPWFKFFPKHTKY